VLNKNAALNFSGFHVGCSDDSHCLHFYTLHCVWFVWVLQMNAESEGTLRGVKAKRWLSYEKCCSSETNFKILHDCHFLIVCLYFMLQKIIDPAGIPPAVHRTGRTETQS